MEGGSALVVRDQVTGVLILGDNDQAIFRFVRLQRKKDEVRLLGHGSAANALDLKKACGTRVPIAVYVHTPRCLHRVLSRTAPLEELVRLAFPGASLDQVHVSGWNEGGGVGVSMARRDHVIDLLTDLRQAGFRIVALHVGPWSMLHLAPTITGPDEFLKANGFSLTSGTLIGFTSAPFQEGELQIGDDKLPKDHALAMAGAWEHLVPASQRLLDDDDTVRSDQGEERARVRYEIGLVALAALLILLLGLDQGLRSWTQSVQDGPEYSFHGIAELRERTEQLQMQVRSREQLAHDLGLEGGIPIALRVARILEQVPKEIQLDRMMVNPFSSPIRDRERPLADPRHIRIRGTCTDGSALNSWVNSLRKISGVRDVRLLAFASQDHGKRPVFEIEVEG